MRSVIIILVLAVLAGAGRTDAPAAKQGNPNQPGDRANTAGKVQELPAELIAAWKKAPAEPGWMSVDRFGLTTFHKTAEGSNGEIPAFRLTGGLAEAADRSLRRFAVRHAA